MRDGHALQQAVHLFAELLGGRRGRGRVCLELMLLPGPTPGCTVTGVYLQRRTGDACAVVWRGRQRLQAGRRTAGAGRRTRHGSTAQTEIYSRRAEVKSRAQKAQEHWARGGLEQAA